MGRWLKGFKKKKLENEPNFKVGDWVVILRKDHLFGKIGVVKAGPAWHEVTKSHVYFVGFDDVPGRHFNEKEIKKPGRIEELLYATSL